MAMSAGLFSPGCLAMGIIGSLLPDIDHSKSSLGRHNPTSPLLRHRGFCHSAAFLAIVCAVAYNFISAEETTALGLEWAHISFWTCTTSRAYSFSGRSKET